MIHDLSSLIDLPNGLSFSKRGLIPVILAKKGRDAHLSYLYYPCIENVHQKAARLCVRGL